MGQHFICSCLVGPARFESIRLNGLASLCDFFPKNVRCARVYLLFFKQTLYARPVTELRIHHCDTVRNYASSAALIVPDQFPLINAWDDVQVYSEARKQPPESRGEYPLAGEQKISRHQKSTAMPYFRSLCITVSNAKDWMQMRLLAVVSSWKQTYVTKCCYHNFIRSW